MSYGSKPKIEFEIALNVPPAKKARTITRRFQLSPKDVTNVFHGVYYSQVDELKWFGVPVLKYPGDIWMYQELIGRTKPTVIIETGTAYGGSAFFLSMMCQLYGFGRVISIDKKRRSDWPMHPRLTYIVGDSVKVAAAVRKYINTSDRVMVILDSNHKFEHVRKELEVYAPLVTSGCYLVVEDTNVNGHPVGTAHGPGPWEAVAEWLPGHAEFVRDETIEKRLVLTFNPSGYLRRVS